MIDPIWVKAVVKALVLPPAGPLLLALFGLWAIARHPRAGRWLALLGVINMVLVKGTREAALANPSGITYADPARYLADLLQKAR